MVKAISLFFALSLVLCFGCVPDDYKFNRPTKQLLLVEGYVDALRGCVIEFKAIYPADSALAIPGHLRYVDPESVYLLASDSLITTMTRDSAGTFSCLPTFLRVGVTYQLVANIDGVEIRSEQGKIPPPPAISFGDAYYGSSTIDDWDILLDVEVVSIDSNALTFTGAPESKIYLSQCNRQRTTDIIREACRFAFGRVAFQAGWFEQFESGTTLHSYVSNIEEEFAEYLTVVYNNDFNWQQTGLFYADENIPPSNLLGAFGYISFQNSVLIEVPRP